ncbi:MULTISPECIES: hypothetical protein [Photobacterium]|nr:MULTISPECIES: hypothetical protein [Photobacterium]WEM42944.1 hypothetical protein PTW35_03840 [Photobacterium sp. DA100]
MVAIIGTLAIAFIVWWFWLQPAKKEHSANSPAANNQQANK